MACDAGALLGVEAGGTGVVDWDKPNIEANAETLSEGGAAGIDDTNGAGTGAGIDVNG